MSMRRLWVRRSNCSRESDGAGHGRAGALGGLHDLLSALVDELMVVGLQADADHFFLSCHLWFLLKTYEVVG